MSTDNFMEIFDKFKKCVEKLGHRESIAGIESLLKSASDATGQNTENILECCDFKKDGELSIEKLEAILAEIRSINFLKNNCFINIKLLKAHKNKKRPDLYAEIATKRFDIEVTCLTNAHSRKKQGSVYTFRDHKFLDEFTGRITKKIAQLETGSNKFKMIIFVLNHYPEKALCNKQEYEKFIEQAYKKSQLSNNWYLGLVTGSNDDDFVFPNLIHV